MTYIAALDYNHLDNGVFLTSLASSLTRQPPLRAIFVHADSAYTERIMQSGVMREEATVRSIQDINHRLVALFADQGISAIGINGYKRKFILQKEEKLQLDKSFYQSLPLQSVLLLSTLVWHVPTATPVAVPLQKMTSFLKKALDADAVFSFSKSDKSEVLIEDTPAKMDWKTLPDTFSKKHLPDEFSTYGEPLHLTTARAFHNPFRSGNTILIE